MYHLKSPRDLIIEFVNSDLFYKPGKHQVAYEKDAVFNAYGDAIFNDDLKYVRLNTETHFQTITVDVDGDIPVDELRELIDDNIIPEPLCVVGGMAMTANGYAHKRPHITFALDQRSTVRRATTTKEIRDRKAKKSRYVHYSPSLKALNYYNGMRKLLCDIFAMKGYKVDKQPPNVTKSPFSKHWHVTYFADNTYGLQDIARYMTDDVKRYVSQQRKLDREIAAKSLVTKLARTNYDYEQSLDKSLEEAARLAQTQIGRVRLARELSREEIISSIAEGTNRNVSLFDLLRLDAYKEKKHHTKYSDFCKAMHEILEEILLDAPILRTLCSFEIGTVFKSVTRWVWHCYRGTGEHKPRNRGAAAHLIDPEWSIHKKQAVGAFYTNQTRRENSKGKVSHAVSELKFRGERLTISAVARESGLSWKTAAKYFVDGEVVLTNSPMFNKLLAGTAVITPAEKRLMYTIAERENFLPKVKTAAQMLWSTVLSGEEKIREPLGQASLDDLEIALITEHLELPPDQITFERLEQLAKRPTSLHERLGVRIEYGASGNSNNLLESLARLEQGRMIVHDEDEDSVPWDGDDNSEILKDPPDETIEVKLPSFLRV